MQLSEESAAHMVEALSLEVNAEAARVQAIARTLVQLVTEAARMVASPSQWHLVEGVRRYMQAITGLDVLDRTLADLEVYRIMDVEVA